MKIHLIFMVTLLLVIPTNVFADNQIRVKLSTELSDWWNSGPSVQESDPSSRGLLNFRYLWSKSSNHWAFDLQFLSEWNYDSVRDQSHWLRSVPQLASQDRAFWQLHNDEQLTLLALIDRAQIIYRNSALRVSVGRFPTSWGRGLVFHPLDVFNAYTPTLVDREFKRGSDSLLIEYLFSTGSELQLLATDRDPSIEFDLPTTTYAVKYYVPFGRTEVETVLAEHYGDSILGISTAIPIQDFLLRMDISRTCLYQGTCKSSGVVNIDYTFNLGGKLVYAFGEYYHNSFGVNEFSQGYSGLPKDLTLRLDRGDLFSIGKNLFAIGANISWHPLWSQTTTVLTNLNDKSFLVQTFVSFTPTDHTSLNVGIRLPYGGTNEEFGEFVINDDAFASGVSGIFGEFIFHR